MSVLITNASNVKGLVVTQSLGKKGVEITTTDCEYLSAAFFSRYSKHHFLCASPERTQLEFVNSIQNHIKRNKIDVLMPINSTETNLISKYKEKFTPFTKVPFEDFPKMMQLHNKNEVMKLASELDIRIPGTYEINNATDIEKFSKEMEYPVVIKLRNATSSVGISYVYSASEFVSKYKQTIQKFNLKSSEYPIVQEYIPGSGYGVSMLYNQGDIRASFTHKRLREYPITGGPSTLRVSVRNQEMENAARKILDHVNWHGVAMVEFKLDERTNKPVLIEVNPRFWGSVYQAIAAGVNFPYLLYEMALYGDVEPVFNYKVGVKTRFLLNDFRALISHLNNSGHRFTTFKEFFKFYEKDLYYDAFSINDALPAMMFAYKGLKDVLNSRHK
ncbi:MAG: ATP-grasp domain-containing protein [Candidatus Methanoperedens sp.]|uniref:carboxylate--amine ligase n=1 Tax=Candidatus Methanoperedens sp. BLZ2 TaxID=2035255 RepID=UPI00159658ED|nr:ATP-grasp domain-containing protein [Candidatus Methanoperedens sp. BLZ2]MBZ0177614.1 ATP-grasp domain-containing protein [Candidatus Methanoperedens nitroreducens]MCX9078104.1 ATP-grasp domain-containing protein [Candidatus Methanoperedens sp.]MCX9088458.1 ATP-grasp domain-containing protein [Candidatus Methanoperedens sp.]